MDEVKAEVKPAEPEKVVVPESPKEVEPSKDDVIATYDEANLDALLNTPLEGEPKPV